SSDVCSSDLDNLGGSAYRQGFSFLTVAKLCQNLPQIVPLSKFLFMEEKFKAIVNNTFEFSLNLKDLETLDIISHNKKANVIFNHKSIEVEILKADFNK